MNGADSLEQSALAAVNIGAWAWDIEEDRITWSDAVGEMFGFERSERPIRLSDALEFVHPADRVRFETELERARTTGSTWDMVHRLNVPGRERWLRARGRVVRDSEGRPLRLVGIIEDESIARTLAVDRNDQSALMQAALDASLFAVVVCDASGQIIYCNELAASLLGLTRVAAQARAYDSPQFKPTSVDGGPWSDEHQPFVRVMKTQSAVNDIEHCIERPDGRVITLRVNAAPIKNDRGEIKLVVCSFEDITGSRAIETSFRQTAKMEAVGRLAGGVAHDFNNLLTAILSYAAFARGELSDSSTMLECLDGIADAGERAAQLTRQLLAFARCELNQPISFDARTEVAATARLITRVLGTQATLNLELPAEPCWIRMDPNQLQQVLMNLTINARDAMPEGGKIRLSVQRTDHDTVALTVTDSGQGMDEQTMQNAFEPFFTTKPAHEGTGLGLSTCHGIVSQAGGRIMLFSRLGHGTRVEIELPLVAAPEPESAAREMATLERKRGARILVVEDDPAVRRIALRALERAGYHVHAAAQASQAMEVLEKQPIDLIVCDLILPGMSGPDLIDRVRQSHPRMRVLFVSGYSSELARLGIDPFLAKPYGPDLLRQHVAKCLEE